MTAPTPTTRVAPVGTRLGDGYQTLVTIAADTDISFWEISATPVGFEGGDKVDTTTMHNVTWMTGEPQTLIDTTPMQIKAAYDPVVLDQLVSILNQKTTITFTYPNGDQDAVWGWVRSAVRDEITRGQMPTMTIVIESGNTDTSGVEAGPNYVTSLGTD